MKDAERGLKIAQVLEGFVHRKVIKQTVMTTVYGVTRFGARHQIARQLKGECDDEFGDLLLAVEASDGAFTFFCSCFQLVTHLCVGRLVPAYLH